MPESFEKISSPDADRRRAPYRKDPSSEAILAELNRVVAPLQEHLEEEGDTGPGLPALLIVGTPRSGSTYLSQCLASSFHVGYPSNLMARFHRAPAVGAYLHREVIGEALRGQREHASVHGVTHGAAEPHEFGYFWARHLGVAGELHEPTAAELELVDRERLRRELRSIQRILGLPVVYKSLLVDFFISVLGELPETVFLELRRDPREVAESILRVRRERMDDPSTWWSLRPRAYLRLLEEPPEVQVAGQVLATRQAVEKQLANVAQNRRMTIEHADLTLEPRATMERLARSLEAAGNPVRAVQPAPDLVPASPGTRLDPAARDRWDRAFETARGLLADSP